jgi:hypothetical protein
MSVELTSIDFKSPDVTDRTHARLMKESLRVIAQNHRLVTMGKHFKKNAETAVGGPYGYVARNPRYVSRKLAKFNTDIPNVRTGRLMRATRNNSVVTATQHRSRLYIKGPSGDPKNPFKFTEQRRKEMEAITPQEVAEAQQLGISTYQALVNKPENQRKRKKRIT